MQVLEVEQVGPYELAEKGDGREGKNGHGGLEAELIRDPIGEHIASVLRVEELPRRLYDVGEPGREHHPEPQEEDKHKRHEPHLLPDIGRQLQAGQSWDLREELFLLRRSHLVYLPPDFFLELLETRDISGGGIRHHHFQFLRLQLFQLLGG